MGFERNVKAYEFFIQIEVGMREFLINLIREEGIQDWVHDFLGGAQRDTLTEVINRINAARAKQESPNLSDEFRVKLNRALKTTELSSASDRLAHPFYYLNWPDIENLMKMKTNSDLIDNSIGKPNRIVLIANLNRLNSLRNDVAHSRFLSEKDLLIIKSVFDQVAVLIPDFGNNSNNQTVEGNLGMLLREVDQYVALIGSSEMLSHTIIEEALDCLNRCIKSFWLNSLDQALVRLLQTLQKEMVRYKTLRNQPGGLMHIEKLKRSNSKLLANIRTMISDGKI